MFNPKRAAKWVGKFLGKLVPILALVFLLGLVMELSAPEAEWAELIASREFWLTRLQAIAPSLLALLGVYLLAIRFVQNLYGISSSKEARNFVNHCLFGLWSFKPWRRLSGGIVEEPEGHILTRVGGPGHLVIYNDTAALLERGGRFTRVVDSGFPPLNGHERVYQVVDLRPLRHVRAVNVLSKEGILLTCEADISYQIDDEGQEPTEDRPFPASKEKVFQAATCTWIRGRRQPGEGSTIEWSQQFVEYVTDREIRSILAQYTLDQLIGLASPPEMNPREEIRRELETRLRTTARRMGAQILAVELGDIIPRDEITRQWIDAWRAEWAKWALELQAQGRAKQVEQMEEAKTRAQVMMIKAITGAFQPMAKQNQAVSSRLILARLFMVLGRAASEPWTRVFLPPEALNTLKLLKEIVE